MGEPATTQPEKIGAHTLLAAIKARYCLPEWRVEPEVTLVGRRIDLVALNLWGARSYRVVGFELKADRGDWMKELSSFQKAEEWQRIVDAFYVVTPPKLVKADELPVGWGHLELCGSRLMTRVYPSNKPEGTTLPREVVARFLGRQAREVEASERTSEWRMKESIRKEERNRAEETLRKEYEKDRQDLRTLKGQYDELLKALCVRPQEWQPHVAAMKAAGVLAHHDYDPRAIRATLTRLAESFAQQHRRLQDAITALPTEEEPRG